MHKQNFVVVTWGLLALLVLLHAGCNQTVGGEHAKAGNVTVERILAEEKADKGNWLAHGRTFNEQRFSPLKQINEQNVGQLGLAWQYKLDVDRGLEATPIVVDGVMYTTGAWSMVYALDARDGKLLWKYDPQVDRTIAAHVCCDVVNRGAAVLDGNVYVATLDGYLDALEAATGKRVWRVDTLTDRTRPYTITGAPRIAGKNIVIGNAGAEFGVRGYVTAYDAKTGKQAWRFFTVPGDPKKPYEAKALEMAAKTWTGDKYWEYGGGGTVWDSMAYDPELNLLYLGVGNGSPWSSYVRSPGGGDNLFLSSIVAVKADTGEYVWHYQTTPGDKYDFTATQHLILADLNLNGQSRKVIMQAPKNGFFYVLDRQTGQFISAEKYVNVTWAKGVDPKTGRVEEDPKVADYSKELKLIMPTPFGGHNWHPMSYSPQTGLVYVPAQDLAFPFLNDPNYKPAKRGFNIGIVGLPDPEAPADVKQMVAGSVGYLLAWNPVTQKAAWKINYKHPLNGGVLSTAGNLVFIGTADGRIVAYSADKGQQVWETSAQTGVIAPPISYAVNGEQYVTVMAGWGGVLGVVGGEIAAAAKQRSVARVLTFKIGGKESLPPLPAAAPIPAPPPLTAAADVVNAGRLLYAKNCGLCHGGAAVSGGVIADLRHLNQTKHDAFLSIVQNGIATQGMPSFGGILKDEEIKAIQAFIIKRAHDEKGTVKQLVPVCGTRSVGAHASRAEVKRKPPEQSYRQQASAREPRALPGASRATGGRVNELFR
ncbi:MAG: PQQ-dependent dehydrogenase, methanol/ethanol family [Blastocatellia bacterium]